MAAKCDTQPEVTNSEVPGGQRDPGRDQWLGISSAPAYVGEIRECNGIAEQFSRTLREECVYLHDFEPLEEAREMFGASIERYNNGWLFSS